MSKEVTFLVPEDDVECLDCGRELDIETCQVILIVVCPHCHKEAGAYKEEEVLH